MVTAVAEARLLGGSGGSINDDSSAPNSGAILDPLFVGQPAAAAAVDPLLLSNSASNDSRHIRRADAVVARSRSGIIGTSGSPTTSTNNNKHGRRPRRWITSVFFAFLIAALTASIVQVIYFHNNNNHGLLLPSFATAVSRHLPEWKLSSGNSTVMASGARGDKHNLSSATKDSLSAESGGTGSNRKDDGTTVANNNPLLKLFESAGVNVGAELTEADRTQLLPSLYENMVRMYGVDERAPVVAGVDTCAAYRDRVPLERRYTAVAGMFNTGTNAMEFHLRRNIKIGAAKASLWQVPWGKHRMPAVTRLVHVAVGMEKVQQEDALPVVMVRDPYSWMQSMVRCVCTCRLC